MAKKTAQPTKGNKESSDGGKEPAASKSILQQGNVVHFEAVVRSDGDASLFALETELTQGNLADFVPASGRRQRAATVLQGLGFRVRHVGTFSISAEGPRGLWEKTFGTKVEKREQLITASPDGGDEVVPTRNVSYWSHMAGVDFTVPPELDQLVERAYPQRPPLFFESPLPPRVGYHHLRVPADLAMMMRGAHVHQEGVTGQGVLVAMTDTGFYRHPFYTWHGYNYNVTLSPDSTHPEKDEVGHGTAEAANVFALAPGVDFIGLKMGPNPTLAFKAAADLYPGVMTNSWGFDIEGPTLPNFLKPLEAAVIEAVRERGITVCFSAGNGHFGFPGQMPEVISVGGAFASESVDRSRAELEASDYASSFVSKIYPGRRVPDVCGLVGMKPRAVYIMLPVEPGDEIDVDLANGGTFPDGDETATDDGWAVISGTSAASPQVAGICALLKQAQPGLSPELVRSVLRSSAIDITRGKSAMGESAGPGHDGATGAGLVDAYAAYRLCRSITPRALHALPGPR